MPSIRPTAGRLVLGLLSLGLVGVLFARVLPQALGVSWSAVGELLRQLTGMQLLGLCVLWFAGLYAHSFVLTAAQPNLTHRRALTLNLTGSAVANVVPLGGALGVGLNYAMIRGWGFSRQSFTVFTLISNLWDVWLKLALPIVALAVLLATPISVAHFVPVATLALGVFVALVGLFATVVVSESGARRVGAAVDWAIARLSPGRLAAGRVEQAVLDFRSQTMARVRSKWPALSVGIVAYAALQAALLYVTLHLVGSDLGVAPVLAAFAAERLLSLVLITPGGVGFVELGMSGLLVAMGGDPAMSAAGVVLYRAFTYGLEIPVGAAMLGGWLWQQARLGQLRAIVTEPAAGSSR